MRKFGYAVVGAGSLGIIWIGANYLLRPGGMVPSFGVPDPPPADDPFLLVKGVRDVGSGLILLALAGTLRGRSRDRAVAAAMLAASVIPIGDATIVLSRGGPAATALGVHGATALAMILGSAALLRGDRSSVRPGPGHAGSAVAPAAATG
ncbi:MAG TPA: DUF4267 domain-containing protein [Pseudonocardia sp.]|jgi:hypothetical protein